MDFVDLYAFIRTFWLVWFMALFIGILAYVYWPRRKDRLESYGRIPFVKDN